MIRVENAAVVWDSPKGPVRIEYQDAIAVGNAVRASIAASRAKAVTDKAPTPVTADVEVGGVLTTMKVADALEWAAELIRRGRLCA